MDIQPIGEDTRYEMRIHRTYRADFDMLSLEYLWAPTLCPCPKMEVGREYIVVGDMASRPGRRESRLQVLDYKIIYRDK